MMPTEPMGPAEPMGPVVVGVDGSETSLPAVDLAAEEAAARLLPLVLVHGYRSGTDQLSADHNLLELAVSRALSDHPCLSVSAKLAVGDPIQVLKAQSAGASLLVVGHRQMAARRSATTRPVLSPGSVAAQLMVQSRCPVITHRPVDPERQTEQPSPVLLGVTRHARTESVVEFAFEEAAMRGAPLRAIHVWPEQGDAARVLREALVAWSEKYPQVEVVHQVWPGTDVARALCDMSHDAQLMVVGAGPYTGRTRLMRGLLTQDLIDYAGCPVAVVPHA